MCIRDRVLGLEQVRQAGFRSQERAAGVDSVHQIVALHRRCLLYTSDAADERSSVDLGGRRIIKKKKHQPELAKVTTQDIRNEDTRS